MHIQRFGLLSLLTLLINASLPAAEKAAKDTVYVLPKVIFVENAIVDETLIRDNATLLTRVSEQQIRDLNALDLPSALRRVPGVTISRYNLVGSYGGAEGGTIYIRGMGAERPGASIQTLVDGVPKFVGVWTHPLMDVLSVDRLERIDIYNSPQPVLWGNMSLGAVNLVTRRMHEAGQRTDLTMLGGQDNTYNFVFNHGARSGAFDYYLGASVKGSQGHRPQADGQLRSYWGRLGYSLAEGWDLSLIASSSDNWADDPGPVGSPPPKRARFNTGDATFNLTLSNTAENRNGYIRYYLDDGKINWEQWNTAGNEWFNTRTDYLNQGLRIQEIFSLEPSTELTVGFDYDSYGGKAFEEHQNPANSLRMPVKDFSNTAAYVSLEHAFRLNAGLTLSPSAGVRVNHHSVFAGQTAPEAGFSLAGEHWNLYGNYSHAFNYAGVYTAWFYNITWHYQNEAYSSLKPERLDHYELGLKLTPAARTGIDIGIFYDRGRDKIRFIAPPPPPPSFANIDRYHIFGMQTLLSFSPLERLALFTGLTLLNPSPEKLPQAPDYTFTLGGNLRFMRYFQISLDLEAQADKYVTNPRFTNVGAAGATVARTGSYAVLNGKLSYYPGRPGGRGRNSQFFLAVENLTDTDYEYLPGYPMPGTTVFAGVTLDY